MDVAYSQGFNPHQIMSFASPLSVGLTSDGEYIDIEFVSLPSEDPNEVVNYLNTCMTDELFVTEMKVLPDKSKTSMALLHACDYMITVKKEDYFWQNMENKEGGAAGEFSLPEMFEAFMQQPQIIILKKTKKRWISNRIFSSMHLPVKHLKKRRARHFRNFTMNSTVKTACFYS